MSGMNTHGWHCEASAVCFRRSEPLPDHRASTRPPSSIGPLSGVRRPGRSASGVYPTSVHRPYFTSLQTILCRRIDPSSVRCFCAVCTESPGQDAPAPRRYGHSNAVSFSDPARGWGWERASNTFPFSQI